VVQQQAAATALRSARHHLVAALVGGRNNHRRRLPESPGPPPNQRPLSVQTSAAAARFCDARGCPTQRVRVSAARRSAGTLTKPTLLRIAGMGHLRDFGSSTTE
jgi:hypothetical protein